jgi:DNA-binding YbaB/EbfC family protein
MNQLHQLLQLGQQMQARLNEMQTQLAQKSITGSSGGGIVTAVVDGRGRLREIKIDPSVIEQDDVEMLEDLVVAAVTDAQAKARRWLEEEWARLAGNVLPWNLGHWLGGL